MGSMEGGKLTVADVGAPCFGEALMDKQQHLYIQPGHTWAACSATWGPWFPVYIARKSPELHTGCPPQPGIYIFRDTWEGKASH